MDFLRFLDSFLTNRSCAGVSGSNCRGDLGASREIRKLPVLAMSFGVRVLWEFLSNRLSDLEEVISCTRLINFSGCVGKYHG